jgi:ABC-type branched-subunit amino acid transport system substrate-binding protein
MAQKPETQFKERIRPLLDGLPRAWWVKTQMLALRGIPDFIGVVNGHFIALELKTDDAEPGNALQRWVLDKIRAAGGIALVVTPLSWPGTYAILKKVAAAKALMRDPAWTAKGPNQDH